MKKEGVRQVVLVVAAAAVAVEIVVLQKFKTTCKTKFKTKSKKTLKKKTTGGGCQSSFPSMLRSSTLRLFADFPLCT
jgi:hypothetical protein